MKKIIRIMKIMIVVAVVIVGTVTVAGKMKLAQNEKNIVGTWGNSSSENIITLQENGKLTLNEAISDIGLSIGEASYYFQYADIISVTQGDVSTQFEIEIEIDGNQLILSVMGEPYWVLQKSNIQTQ